MKLKTLAVSLVLATGLGIAGAAQADGKIYVGAKVGPADTDITGASSDYAHVIGVYGGYIMLGKNGHYAADLKGGNLAIEGEMLVTLLKGDAGAGKWDMNSLGVFGAYRHPFTDTFYVKGKAGLVRYDVDTTAGTADSGTSLAIGAGAGWKIGPGSLEVELTSYEGNVLLVTGGFHMSF